MTEYVRRLREVVGGGELLQVPSVSIALRDAEGRVLLVRHVEGTALVDGIARPDGTEVLEVRFVSEPEGESLSTARWVPEVLRAVFHRDGHRGFRPPTWMPRSVKP